MNKKSRGIILTIISILLLVSIYQYVLPTTSTPKESNISDIVTLVRDNQVDSIKVSGNKVTAKLKDKSEVTAFKESAAKLTDYGISSDKVVINIEDPDKGTLFPSIVSVVLPFILVGILLWFMLRSAQGANMRAMSFGKTQARLFGGNKKVSFADVAGAKEAKFELEEVVEFLKSPDKFKKLGAEIPKGVLLIGPPGTGKTLMAKAVAGEAGVPFFSISASEFVEMFVGVGAARVRDLFNKAKSNAPSILFIDELDAIGRQRGSGLGGSHDEREQTLNQILVEMDGFETDMRVIVLASTNRPDVLDPALLRPGRFDRRVIMDLPDRSERLEILKIHTLNKPLSKDVNLEHIASTTPGFSGADLRNIVNEAAIMAARAAHKQIEGIDFNHAIEKVMLGPERKSRVLQDHELQQTAYHEAGHAIVGQILEHSDSVHKISIISRGMALGYTWSRPGEDKHLKSQQAFEDDLASLLAGRAAEEIVFSQHTTGAANDLEKATKIVREMVMRYGMSDKIGPISMGQKEEMVFLGRDLGEHKTYSDKIATIIDEEMKQIINKNVDRAKKLLIKHRTLLDRIAKLLLKQETIEGDEFAKIVDSYLTKLSSFRPLKNTK